MGKQIEIFLSKADEESLIAFLTSKFSIQIADSSYPLDWDKKLAKTDKADTWIIFDSRRANIIRRSAAKFYDYDLKANRQGDALGWHVWSRDRSCIEWTRMHISEIVPRGRLYLNTYHDPRGLDTPEEIGDAIERIYKTACRWIKRNCVNYHPDSRFGFWVSKSKVKTIRKAHDKEWLALSKEPPDPRDKRFWKLQGKEQSKLTDNEINLCISYCDKMIKYVKRDANALQSWQEWRDNLEQIRASRNQQNTVSRRSPSRSAKRTL
jgi:hypothetical protein